MLRLNVTSVSVIRISKTLSEFLLPLDKYHYFSGILLIILFNVHALITLTLTLPKLANPKVWPFN